MDLGLKKIKKNTGNTETTRTGTGRQKNEAVLNKKKKILLLSNLRAVAIDLAIPVTGL